MLTIVSPLVLSYQTKKTKVMKRKFLLQTMLVGLFIGLLSFTTTSCDKSDDLTPEKVPTVVKSAFETKYPAIQNVRWEKAGKLFKAEFYNVQGKDVDAYFNGDGGWVRSETDLLPIDLPAEIATVVSTNWPDYYVDDVDLMESPSEVYYLIELDKLNAREIYVRILADGTIKK